MADHVVLDRQDQNVGLKGLFPTRWCGRCTMGDCNVAGGTLRGAIESGLRVGSGQSETSRVGGSPPPSRPVEMIPRSRRTVSSSPGPYSGGSSCGVLVPSVRRRSVSEEVDTGAAGQYFTGRAGEWTGHPSGWISILLPFVHSCKEASKQASRHRGAENQVGAGACTGGTHTAPTLASWDEGHRVEDRQGRLATEGRVEQEPLDHVLVPDGRASRGDPEPIDTHPIVWRVVVDLSLCSLARRLYRGDVRTVRVQVHAVLHDRIAVGGPVPPYRRVAHERDPVVCRCEAMRPPSRSTVQRIEIWPSCTAFPRFLRRNFRTTE